MIVSLLLVSGCSNLIGGDQAASATTDPALAQFVSGTWVYEGDYLYRGMQYSDVYRGYSFEDGRIVWISTGEEGSRCTYHFTGPEVLAVECEPQPLDLRALLVRREGESLLIQELDERLSPLGEQLKFTKVGGG